MYGGKQYAKKCVHVCGTILLVLWDNYPNYAPQGAPQETCSLGPCGEVGPFGGYANINASK